MYIHVLLYIYTKLLKKERKSDYIWLHTNNSDYIVIIYSGYNTNNSDYIWYIWLYDEH